MTGEALLYSVEENGDMIGAYALRAEKISSRTEGVIIGAGGSHKGVSLLETVLPVIEQQFMNCDLIRVHTERKGLVKVLSSRGWKQREIVMEKKLNGI